MDDRIGRFRVLGRIGAGGMGVVYRAHDERIERDVAVKVLPDSVVHDRRRLTKFEQEARAAGALAHPNVMAIYDLGIHDGSPFIVSELLTGVTLGETIAGSGLPVARVVDLARQLAAGLAAAHDRGIIHRDLKPSNIFICAEDHLKILDFGIAKLRDAGGSQGADWTSASDGTTVTRSFVGTPGYAAPEQVLGRAVDERADIFAAGCVIHEMLTGRPAFDREAGESLGSSVVEDRPADLGELRPEAPSALVRIVNTCLEKDPGKRYRSARELASALDAIESDPSGAPPAGWPRRLVMATAAVVGVALAAWGVLEWRPTRSAVPFESRDRLLIASFENLTDDDVFDRSLDAALRVGMEQSQHVRVLTRHTVRRTLERMRRDPDAQLGEDLAKEVATRQGVEVLLVPSISRVASTYVLTATLLDPETERAYASRAVHAEGLDEVLPALERLVRGLRRDLGESVVALAAERPALIAATTSSLQALQVYSKAVDHLVGGDFEAARELFEKTLILDPDFVTARASLGTLNVERFDREVGAAQLEEAMAEDSGLSDRERHRIRAFYAQFVEGDLATAAAELETQIELDPDDAAAFNNLARVYQAMGRTDDAIAAFQQSVDLDPELTIAFNGLVQLYFALGRVEDARHWSIRQLEIDQQSYWGHVQLAWAHAGLDQPELAEHHARMAVGIRRDLVRGHYCLGHALRLQGRYAEAAAVFGRIAHAQPDDPWAHYQQGAALESAGHPNEARRHFRTYVEIFERWLEDEPDNTYNRLFLDIGLIRLGESRRSTFTAEQRAVDEPGWAFDLANLAAVEGDLEEALRQARRSVDLGFDQPIWLKVHPDFEPLWGDPRFRQLTDRSLHLDGRQHR